MDAAACSHSSVDSPFFSEASSEEKLLQSYDRFYKAVNKLTGSTHSTLPSLEAVLCGAQKLPEDARKELGTVWERAERFGQLQNVTQRFHVYRSDLVKKWKRRSRTESMSSTEVEEGMKDLLQNQSRLEQQMNFMNAMLIGVDQRTEQLPSLMEKILKKRDDEVAQENVVLRGLLMESQKRIDRLEQLVMKVDAKLGAWKGDGRDCEGLKYASASWPETVHNNIIAYSSSVGSSILEGSNSETSRPISAVPVEESSDEDEASDLPAPQSSAHATTKLEISEMPGPVLPSSAEAMCAEDKTDLEAKPDASTDLDGKLESSIRNPFFDGESSASPFSTALTQSAFSKSGFNKVMNRMELNKGKELAGHEQEKRGMSADFSEAFLQDALRVQENILTSSLGHLSTIEDTISQPSIPQDIHSPSKNAESIASNKTEHSDDGTGDCTNECETMHPVIVTEDLET